MSTAIETGHKIVSREEWTRAHAAHLANEKELTRHRDEVSRQRRELPWVRVEKNYVFDGPNGKERLSDLFDGKSQLIIYHFMFGPEWQEGCTGCSFLADHMDGAIQHLVHHDVSFVVVSRAPFAKLEAFRKRMSWKFKWVSSYLNDFNFNYHVSFSKDDMSRGRIYYNFEERNFESDELPGISVFYKDENGDIFHTFSSYARGGDILLGAYNYLDMTPNGRNETRGLMDWVKLHDRYEGVSSSRGCHGDTA
jgi:predicted dithiol-disulfide oxidoreductase (DUF899 family)